MSQFACPHGSPPRCGWRDAMAIDRFQAGGKHKPTHLERHSAKVRLQGVCKRYPPCLAALDGERKPYPDPVTPSPGGTGLDPDTPPGGTPVAIAA